MSDLHKYGGWRRSLLDKYKIKEFHYITDISNIYSIYNHEMIFSRNEANEKLDGKFKDWSNHSVQDLRDKEMDFFYFKDYFLRLCLAVFLIFPFSPSLDIASLKPI